jgi:hypothetical protein
VRAHAPQFSAVRLTAGQSRRATPWLTRRGYRRLRGRPDADVDTALTVERAILREAQTLLNELRHELDAKVAALVAERLAPLDAVEARIFLGEFKRGDLS